MTKSFYKYLLLYGIGIAFFLLFVKYLDYSLFVRAIPFEVYVGTIAFIFTVLGVGMGLKLTRPKTIIEHRPSGAFILDRSILADARISEREYEVLSLIAKGYSNQEIADELFISLSTVKTHTSHLFEKLDAKRRTQVIKKGQELGLLP